MIRLLLIIVFLLAIHYSQAQISGCTDPKASNYNADATQNDGNCIYNSLTIDPVVSWNLPENVFETSGLLIWENKLWTHNDDTDINIYSFGTDDIDNNRAYQIAETVNIDWEEISQDSNYIYIGDFGNNSNGNRTNLQILRIEKKSVLANSPLVDTIQFSYSLQTDFNPVGPNKTDFDCEAFIVSSDSIYLFTKEWSSNKSSIYSLPKWPGEYIAKYQSNYDVQGLITGSVYLESKNVAVLCGYSTVLQPFMIMLYDFNNNLFFSGNKRKISINLPFHQVEGIATEDGLEYYISNEKLSQSIVVEQKLHKIDLSEYLGDYLISSSNNLFFNGTYEIKVYPNPSNANLFIRTNRLLEGKEYTLIDMSGKIVLKGEFIEEEIQINIENLDDGSYILMVNSPGNYIAKKIIKN